MLQCHGPTVNSSTSRPLSSRAYILSNPGRNGATPEWNRTILIDDAGRVYGSACVMVAKPDALAFAAMLAGVPIAYGGPGNRHPYVPTDWARREAPQAVEVLDKMDAVAEAIKSGKVAVHVAEDDLVSKEAVR